MEITVLRIPSGLQAPAGKGSIQEGIDTVKRRLDADSAAVLHVQFHNDVAALDQIELLTDDVFVIMGNILFTEPLQKKTLAVVKNAEA